MLSYYFTDTPPSTARIEPVVQEESSDAKYKTALAISSPVPILPRGCSAEAIFLFSFVFNQNNFVISVSTTAAQIQFTRILFLAYSNAKFFVRCIKAAFDTE